MDTGWINIKRVINVMEDNDYPGMFLILLFPTSIVLGYIYGDYLTHGFKIFAPAFVVILFLIERGIVSNRKSKTLDRIYNDILQRMNEQRSKPAFQNGSLDYILIQYFSHVDSRCVHECIKRLQDEKEVEIGPFIKGGRKM